MKILCLDIGGTKIASAIVDDQMRTADVKVEPTPVHIGPQAVLDQITEIAKRTIERYSGIAGVSIASAGPLELETGSWLSPTNFLTNGKPWGRVELVRPLREVLGVPVFLENDAACAALGEFALEKKYRSIAVITLGTGVGIGVIVNGELVRKDLYEHPEVSHIPLYAGGAICECGLSGCIEAYLASTHFARRLSESQKTWLKTGDVVNAARVGERWALEAFDLYAEHLAQTFMILKTLYQPQMIAVSGGLAAISEMYYPKAIERFEQMRAKMQSASAPVEFKVSPHTYELSLFGAAAKAFRMISDSPVQRIAT